MYNEGVRTFTASGAVTARSRVKIASGTTTTPPQVALAGSGDEHVGISEYAAADGAIFSVKLRGYPGSVEILSATSLSIGASAWGANSGLITSATGGVFVGLVLEAATAASDIVEILQY
jgi:hypothetical protein